MALAFDVNLNINKAEQVLAIDDSDNRPSLVLALSIVGFYELHPERAQAIVQELTRVVRDGLMEPSSKPFKGRYSADSQYFCYLRQHVKSVRICCICAAVRRLPCWLTTAAAVRLASAAACAAV